MWSRYTPGVAQWVGRGIALLFHDRGTRRWRVVSSTPLPHFTVGKDPVSIVQEAVWAPGPVWTSGKSRPHRDSIPDRPARSQSLYRLSYRAHIYSAYKDKLQKKTISFKHATWSKDSILCFWRHTIFCAICSTLKAARTCCAVNVLTSRISFLFSWPWWMRCVVKHNMLKFSCNQFE
jgi:hypothetical protein